LSSGPPNDNARRRRDRKGEDGLPTESREKTVLGVVGGMGPLASAEFLRTIYEHSLGEREQDSPVVLLYSDPGFPDRTDAFLAGEAGPLLARLIEILNHLLANGANQIVLCCMTIHYLVPRLPAHLVERIISLVDVVMAELINIRKRHLLICSMGTLQMRLFQQHPDWPQAEPFVVFPTESDQLRIHRELIYPIKQNPNLAQLFPLLESLLERYEVNDFIAGCTEVHLLAKQIASGGVTQRPYRCIDPLTLIAQKLASEYQPETQAAQGIRQFSGAREEAGTCKGTDVKD
jgi:aspartate racemase